MTHDVPYLLVDTNVWLSAYLPQRPGHNDVVSFFNTARQHRAQLLYASTSIRDVFYIAGRTLKNELRTSGMDISDKDAQSIQHVCWGIVDNIREMATAVGTDEVDIWRAAKMRTLHGDFEDDLVRAAAFRAKADLIVTWDKGLLQKALCATLTPPDATAWLFANSTSET